MQGLYLYTYRHFNIDKLRGIPVLRRSKPTINGHLRKIKNLKPNIIRTSKILATPSKTNSHKERLDRKLGSKIDTIRMLSYFPIMLFQTYPTTKLHRPPHHTSLPPIECEGERVMARRMRCKTPSPFLHRSITAQRDE